MAIVFLAGCRENSASRRSEDCMLPRELLSLAKAFRIHLTGIRDDTFSPTHEKWPDTSYLITNMQWFFSTQRIQVQLLVEYSVWSIEKQAEMTRSTRLNTHNALAMNHPETDATTLKYKLCTSCVCSRHQLTTEFCLFCVIVGSYGNTLLSYFPLMKNGCTMLVHGCNNGIHQPYRK